VVEGGDRVRGGGAEYAVVPGAGTDAVSAALTVPHRLLEPIKG
jgi:hypothetical protein